MVSTISSFVAIIAATVAITAAHRAHRACLRAEAELSRAIRLASVAEARAFLAIERVSSSRVSRLDIEAEMRSSSLCANHSCTAAFSPG